MNKNLMVLAIAFAATALITTDPDLIPALAAPAPTPSPRKIARVPAPTPSPVITGLKPTGNEVSVESRKKKRRRPRSNR